LLDVAAAMQVLRRAIRNRPPCSLRSCPSDVQAFPGRTSNVADDRGGEAVQLCKVLRLEYEFDGGSILFQPFDRLVPGIGTVVTASRSAWA